MNDLDTTAFVALFKEAYLQCFGHPMESMLSETESKQFSTQILDQTGLVIGPKSIKNYSAYISNGTDTKKENPSVATLDTFARYVLKAPYTDEIHRKDKENHYPYWFQYKDQFYRSSQTPGRKKRSLRPVGMVIAILVILAVIAFFFLQKKETKPFLDEFRSVANDSLADRKWFVRSMDSTWWNRRGEMPMHLTLFTLKGDNWPDSVAVPDIKNLVLRPMDAECFTIEAHLTDFFPVQNWQQAGILLLEDTGFAGKSIRLSIAYNDFFGGFSQKPQIILQAISSMGKNSKPEEIIHKEIFAIDSGQSILISNNLRRSGLRIEKRGRVIRFLHSSGPLENFAFKEAGSQEFPISVRYIGIFALKGQVTDTMIIPAHFSYFSFVPEKCVN
jgi:hypothetical protein